MTWHTITGEQRAANDTARYDVATYEGGRNQFDGPPVTTFIPPWADCWHAPDPDNEARLIYGTTGESLPTRIDFEELARVRVTAEYRATVAPGSVSWSVWSPLLLLDVDGYDEPLELDLQCALELARVIMRQVQTVTG